MKKDVECLRCGYKIQFNGALKACELLDYNWTLKNGEHKLYAVHSKK
jgi:hypothetical protein